MPITTPAEKKRLEALFNSPGKKRVIDCRFTEEDWKKYQQICYHNAINRAESDRLQSEAACRNMYRKYHG